LLRNRNGNIALLKTKTLRVKSNLCEGKRRAEDGDTPNNSMDVRAKQLLFKTCVVTFTLRVFGFAPRHLNRSAILGLENHCN